VIEVKNLCIKCVEDHINDRLTEEGYNSVGYDELNVIVSLFINGEIKY
jgi:hypothetical protein